MSDDKVSVTEIVPALSKITECKLNGSNYLDWSRKIRVYLRCVEKDDHLSEDPPTDETKRAWMRDDARLFLQIINSIDNEVVGLVNHCEFVKELMVYLEYLYSGKGYMSRVYEVCKAFYSPEMEDKTLTTYFTEFKKIYEELNMLFTFITDIKVQQAQREQMAIISFFAGLPSEFPSEFETAKSQILSSSEITSPKGVFSWVLHSGSTSNQQTNELVAKGEEKNDARRNYSLQTYSDSQNHVTGLRIVVPTCAPLANAKLEDRNIDNLCGSPIVFSYNKTSFYNKENNVEPRSEEESCKGGEKNYARWNYFLQTMSESFFAGRETNVEAAAKVWPLANAEDRGLSVKCVACTPWHTAAESYKGADHGQAGQITSKVEWVEQYQLGVYVTLTVLPSGKNELKQVSFSTKKFTEKEAEKWWEENRPFVYMVYDIEEYDNLKK